MKEKLLKTLIEIHLINNNTKKVWEALAIGMSYSYTQLMNATKLSRSTLYDALHRLEKDDFIERTTAVKVVDFDGKSKAGRPLRLWRLSEKGEYVKS